MCKTNIILVFIGVLIFGCTSNQNFYKGLYLEDMIDEDLFEPDDIEINSVEKLQGTFFVPEIDINKYQFPMFEKGFIFLQDNQLLKVWVSIIKLTLRNGRNILQYNIFTIEESCFYSTKNNTIIIFDEGRFSLKKNNLSFKSSSIYSNNENEKIYILYKSIPVFNKIGEPLKDPWNRFVD